MRFAGQRFRAESGAAGKYREPRFQAVSGRNPYVNPTNVGAMTNMREINAQNTGAFTGMRDMSYPNIGFPGIQEPDFAAPSRI